MLKKILKKTKKRKNNLGKNQTIMVNYDNGKMHRLVNNVNEKFSVES